MSPIDSSIYDRLIQPLQKPDSPLAIMQGVANLRDSAALAQDRRSLIQERMQKAQLEAQDRQEQAQMQTVVQQNGGDIEKSYPQLSAINAEKADKYLQAHLQNAELQSKLGEIDTQKKSTVAGYVTKNLQGVQNQHDYDVARAQIQSARTLVGLPPASEQEMPAVYDPARVSQMIQNGQMTQEVLGKQQKGTPAFYTLPGDPTPHLMKTTPDGQVIWNGQDVREQAQPWDKTAGAEDKVQSAEIEAIKAFTAANGRKPNEAELDGIHKRFKEAGTVVRVSTGGAGTQGGLTAGEGGGLELAGTMTRLLGRVPVGMARAGTAPAIMNEAARQNKLIGQTPVAMMQKAAVYASDKKALDNLTKQSSAAEAYENKAQAQLDIVDGLSDKVKRTSIPLLNRAILAGETSIMGDPDATLLLNSIQTASAEYAKIMMGGTASAAALTDSAQKEAQKLLSASMNPTTLRKATQLMRTEMGLTMQGYDAAKQHISTSLGGGASQAAPQAPDAATLRQKYKY
jgi:hypothetical protein